MAKTKTVTTKIKVIEAVDIVDADGKVIRTFDEETHGEKKYMKLAKQFVEKTIQKNLRREASKRNISIVGRTIKKVVDEIRKYDTENREQGGAFELQKPKIVPKEKEIEEEEEEE